MPYKYNKSLINNSQNLRRNMTPEERHLWYDFLKKLPTTVNRQKMIGEYIVDFYIHSAKLAIEIDGIQHSIENNQKSDSERDQRLRQLGIAVLRYNNETVSHNFTYVCEDILNYLGLSFEDIK